MLATDFLLGLPFGANTAGSERRLRSRIMTMALRLGLALAVLIAEQGAIATVLRDLALASKFAAFHFFGHRVACGAAPARDPSPVVRHRAGKSPMARNLKRLVNALCPPRKTFVTDLAAAITSRPMIACRPSRNGCGGGPMSGSLDGAKPMKRRAIYIFWPFWHAQKINVSQEISI
jgi:hypothetical protein